MKYRLLAAIALIVAPMATTTAASAAEVNVYSYRQALLVKPLFDAFTKETGVKVNVVFAKKRPDQAPAGGRAQQPCGPGVYGRYRRGCSVVNAGLCPTGQDSRPRESRSAEYRDAKGLWYGLTLRAR